MNKLILLTDRNDEIRSHLARAGHDPFNIIIPEGGFIPYIDNPLFIVQAEDSDRFRFSAEEAKKRGAGIIAVGEDISDDVRSILISEGIAHYMTYSLMEEFPEALAGVKSAHLLGGNIYLFDDCDARVTIVRRIALTFGIELECSSDMDGLHSAIERGESNILVNIGIESFDINRFVKRALTNPHIRKRVIIPYKESGIAAREVYSGLNRIAKVILSPEELLSFLVSVYQRKDFFTSMTSLQGGIDFDSNHFFSELDLKMLYHSHGSSIFTLDSFACDSDLVELNRKLKAVRQSLANTASLKWLILERGVLNPCGLGV